MPAIKRPRATVEAILTSSQGFNLGTATAVQRAICRSLDGLPLGDLWDDEAVRAAFGGSAPIVGTPPPEACILAAIRCGKSLISAVTAVRATQTVDFSKLGPGETPRIPILATDKDTAQVVFQHLVGNVVNSKGLSHLMDGPPTADSIVLKAPGGRRVEIKVTALSRAGSTLVGRWLAGVIFDEAPRMGGDEETVLSLDQARMAVRGRMLPGAQILYIGSPWAPAGPVYDMSNKWWGKPSPEGVLVVRAPGWTLNPLYWTPERCEQEKKADPAAYVMNVCAEFGDPEQSLIPSAAIEKAKRQFREHLEPEEHVYYSAAMDPATRGNAWTLVIIGCRGINALNGRRSYFVAYHQQWRGSPKEPLSPDAVLAEISATVGAYGVVGVVTDQYSADALIDLAKRHNLNLYSETLSGPLRLELFDRLRINIIEGCLELPPDNVVSRDLVSVSKKLTTNGYSIVLPSTGDGRHSDYAAALALSMAELPQLPREKSPYHDKDLMEAIRRINPPGDSHWDSLANRLGGYDR